MATWIVTGSNRGIGLEVCRQLEARGDTVIATCRKKSKELEELRARSAARAPDDRALGCRVVEGIDVANPSAGEALDRALGDVKIDVLFNNAGVLRPDALTTFDIEGLRHDFEVNAAGPLLLTRALLKRLHRGSKIGFVSSRAGSIGDGPSGGLYGYRLSKTALNMAAVNLATDLREQGILVAILHPGFVRTQMTGNGGNVEPPAAAKDLIGRMDELTPERSGRFFHANGQELPW